MLGAGIGVRAVGDGWRRWTDAVPEFDERKSDVGGIGRLDWVEAHIGLPT